MSCLVILELENGAPTRPSLATITASRKLSEDVDVLVVDGDSKSAVEKSTNAKNIYYLNENNENLIAEQMVELLRELSSKFDYILAPSGTFSKNFMAEINDEVHKSKKRNSKDDPKKSSSARKIKKLQSD